MRISDFKFTEDRVKRQFVRDEGLVKKITFAIKYLRKHIPINKLDDDFDFSKLETNKGKNYDWFILEKTGMTMLVRKYGNHFTFFVSFTEEGTMENISVFTIKTKERKMTDDLVGDDFHAIRSYLPKLIDIIENKDVYFITNRYRFKEPLVKASIGLDDGSAYNLDLLIFATDELFSKYIQVYSENDILNTIKKIEVGDMLDVYKVVRIESELIDGEYHSCGLELQNTNFPKEVPKWCDVYILGGFYDDVLNHALISIEENILKYSLKNMDKVMSNLMSGAGDNKFLNMLIKMKYKDELYRMYNKEYPEVERALFMNAFSIEDNNFIDAYFRKLLIES